MLGELTEEAAHEVSERAIAAVNNLDVLVVAPPGQRAFLVFHSRAERLREIEKSWDGFKRFRLSIS